jgi:hypothetical protein
VNKLYQIDGKLTIRSTFGLPHGAGMIAFRLHFSRKDFC